jgi:uncharacterized protein (TIGR02145 family)
MKSSIVFTMLLLALSGFLFAQTPQSFKYQAVARDGSGAVLANQTVGLRVQILKGSTSGAAVYVETHSAFTNPFGLINLEIGRGNVQTGEFAGIEWGIDDYFLRLDMDASGGTNYQMMGVAQLLSVPYTLFARNGVQFDTDMDCNENNEGAILYDPDTKTLKLCDGSEWVELGSGSSPFDCGTPLIDIRDGQVYATVAIGSQCWMAQNLNYGVFAESFFTNEVHSDVSNNGVVEKYALDNDPANFALYGGLYDWNELMNYTPVEGSQGVCPEGWHVPTHDEFMELINTVGGVQVAGQALKVGGSSGFNFPMGGSRTSKGGFTVGGTATIWTSSPSPADPDTRARSISFTEANNNVLTVTDVMEVGKACRCIKD